MSNIKNMDSTSPRGKRSVSVGIGTPEGKQYLNGFDFNIHAPLDSVLFNEYTLDTVTGEVVIADISTLEELRYPEGATHVSFQCGVLNLDFSTGLDDLVLSPVENLELKIAPTTVTLTPASMPTGAGVDIFILMISFYQEVNGNQYSLRNEEFNVLHVIDVV
ncbi:hypothetical protein [Flavobacterium capsici]|uniref:Uncharacterized protein n=1 Tax=Flavobacterium capsici TaxID=3075618 RepID=A0AA96F3F8_9FLAO|nr:MULTISPECIES: hypothetical protein [unclassified Flavobacterium]WNM17970.1 hypothetical protein RN608_08085 [Flavobacterium sp. PMR2A8]WNM22022.1 hypothetical protein RN605_01385 [Flavobacterium sp. PMTSA4]